MSNLFPNAVAEDASSRTTTAPAKVWPVAFATVVLGLVSALLAYWPSTHLIECILGALTLPLAAWGQMVSTETNQRWLLICGVIAGGFGLGLGIAHGGFRP